MQLLDQHLARIRENLLMMSSLVDRNFNLAMRAMVERDDRLADLCESEDGQVDQLEVSIDEMLVRFMATHGPIAQDCRFMLVACKISSNLERIADEAVSIARRSRELNEQPLLKPLIDIPRMAQIAQEMMHDAMTAFVDRKTEMTREIKLRDKVVDDLHRQIARELTSYMVEDPSTITRALALMVVAKSIERIADHAKNIAEEVHFLYRAQDIRHGHA
jgi:phosphate transport system protein